MAVEKESLSLLPGRLSLSIPVPTSLFSFEPLSGQGIVRSPRGSNFESRRWSLARSLAQRQRRRNRLPLFLLLGSPFHILRSLFQSTAGRKGGGRERSPRPNKSWGTLQSGGGGRRRIGGNGKSALGWALLPSSSRERHNFLPFPTGGNGKEISSLLPLIFQCRAACKLPRPRLRSNFGRA